MNILIGTGVLTWNSAERTSDRYGAVALMPDGATSRTAEESYIPIGPISGRGRLVAVVLQSRTSTHIGDLFRKIYPSRTATGSRILLNERVGTVFLANDRGMISIGIRPDDLRRSTDWLDPRQLYRVHEHLVELWLEKDP
ncbi:MAG TPA: hypothetical protein VLF66_06585 [Thermoanaerobaculia bacterium]|nr:hypothetical protein [Thermoanaerobaculia bacterium]